MNKILGKYNKVLPTSYITEISMEIPKRSYKPKIDDKLFMIPEIGDYNYILQYNFKVTQLKAICKYYNLKLSGNKSEL